jgi:hypothetical protein
VTGGVFVLNMGFGADILQKTPRAPPGDGGTGGGRGAQSWDARRPLLRRPAFRRRIYRQGRKIGRAVRRPETPDWSRWDVNPSNGAEFVGTAADVLVARSAVFQGPGIYAENAALSAPMLYLVLVLFEIV